VITATNHLLAKAADDACATVVVCMFAFVSLPDPFG
jgi:hypothetical protein